MKTKKLQAGQYEIKTQGQTYLADKELGGWNLYLVETYEDGREGLAIVATTDTLAEAKELASC